MRRREAGTSKTFAIATIAVLAILLIALFAKEPLYRLAVRVFGPPQVEMTEAFESREDSPVVDHSLWDGVLKSHVRDGGRVDYDAIGADTTALDAYVEQLSNVDLDSLDRDERLALLINAYNAFTVRLILDHDDGSLESIKDIPDAERWDAVRWDVGGNVWSLNQIEHEEIRPKFADARIHFVLVCAAYSCPPLRPEAYTGERVDEQMEEQTVLAHSGDRWFRFDDETSTVYRTELYDWYRGDFEQETGDILEYMADYSDTLRAALDAGRDIRQQKIDYSWALND